MLPTNFNFKAAALLFYFGITTTKHIIHSKTDFIINFDPHIAYNYYWLP